MALHSAHDRIGDATAVFANGVRLEPKPLIADECANQAVLYFDVDGQLVDAGVVRAIQDGLAAGSNQGAQSVIELRIADDDDFDLDVVAHLDPTGDFVDGISQGDASNRWRPAEEPGTQLALLRSGEACHLAWLA